jgi:hypothetical protein
MKMVDREGTLDSQLISPRGRCERRTAESRETQVAVGLGSSEGTVAGSPRERIAGVLNAGPGCDWRITRFWPAS